MVLRRCGLVATLLAAVCCGGLLTGCASEENDSDYDYEEKKALDYWNKDYKADDYEWKDITNDNKDEIVGTWKAVYEFTAGMEMVESDEIGYSASMEFVIDASFKKCKFTFISDSSKCKSKWRYTSEDDGAKWQFSKEFVDGDGYKYKLECDDKKCIATAAAENLSLEQLIEVLRCEKFFINDTKDRLLLKNRSKNLPATWQFTSGTDDEHCYDYVIARTE